MLQSRSLVHEKHCVLSLVWALFLILVTATGTQANESDLWTTHTGPEPIAAGTMITVTVDYGNNGPEQAASAYLNAFFTPPMGLDVFVRDTLHGPGLYHDAIQASATGTDTLGNHPWLFWNDYLCEDLFFQLQGDDLPGADPVEGLDPGVTASFSYDVMIPMERPKTAAVEIIQPKGLKRVWRPANSSTVMSDRSAYLGLYGRGSCESPLSYYGIDACEDIVGNCFGARVSQLDNPIDAIWELVDDGSADASFGCDPLIGFTPGNAAVIRRGSCEFGTKVINAEQAGAVAAVIINSDLCLDFPSSDQCVITMGAASVGLLATIPVVMLAQLDGDPIVSALVSGQTVRGVFGGSPHFRAETGAFLSDSLDNDPIEDNNADLHHSLILGEDCDFEVSPQSAVFGPSSDIGMVNITTGANCAWFAENMPPWITFNSPIQGQGTGLLEYEVAANPGPSRAAAIRIADKIHYVRQSSNDGCLISVQPSAMALPGEGGDRVFDILTSDGCSWEAESTVPWMKLTSPSTGVGTGRVTFSAAPNPYGSRTGAVLIGDMVFSTAQDLWRSDQLFHDNFESATTAAWSDDSGSGR